MPDLPIRLASDADLPGVMRLVEAVIAGMRAQSIEQWDEVYPAADTLSTDIADGALRTCAVGDDPVGAIFVIDEHHDPNWRVPWTPVNGPAAVVHRLMVHPRHQGRGLARALMEYAEGLARKRGCRAVHLDAFSQNPQALNLYRRLGYRQVGTVTLRKGSELDVKAQI